MRLLSKFIDNIESRREVQSTSAVSRQTLHPPGQCVNSDTVVMTAGIKPGVTCLMLTATFQTEYAISTQGRCAFSFFSFLTHLLQFCPQEKEN